MKIFDIIFYRAYKYYGKDVGLLYSTILLAGISSLISVGIYIIIFKSFNNTTSPLWFLENIHSRYQFRLIIGPLVLALIQQFFYWVYRYKNYYKRVNEFYAINYMDNFIFKQAHIISFICSGLFFISSFFLGDFCYSILHK